MDEPYQGQLELILTCDCNYEPHASPNLPQVLCPHLRFQRIYCFLRRVSTHAKSLASHLPYLLDFATFTNVRVRTIPRLELSDAGSREAALGITTFTRVATCAGCEDGRLDMRQVLGRGEEDELVAILDSLRGHVCKLVACGE